MMELVSEKAKASLENINARLRLDTLLRLAGNWQDGSCETVTLGWDDATHTFHIKAGKKWYYGNSFNEAIGKAHRANPPTIEDIGGGN